MVPPAGRALVSVARGRDEGQGLPFLIEGDGLCLVPRRQGIACSPRIDGLLYRARAWGFSMSELSVFAHCIWRFHVPSPSCRQAWRGIGRNFSTACNNLLRGVPFRRAANASDGIGASMRIAPLGAALAWAPAAVLRDAVFATTLCTHATLEVWRSEISSTVSWRAERERPYHPLNARNLPSPLHDKEALRRVAEVG